MGNVNNSRKSFLGKVTELFVLQNAKCQKYKKASATCGGQLAQEFETK